MNTLAASGTSTGDSIALVIILLVPAFIAYWVPWFVAWRRHVPNVGAVFVVNLFLGWSVIGWIVALAMAVRTRPAPAVNGA